MSLTEENLLVVDEDDDVIAEAKNLFDGGLPTARGVNEALQANGRDPIDWCLPEVGEP